MLLLLLGCFGHYPLVTATAPVQAAAVHTEPELPAITFSPLEEKLEIVFTSSSDDDQRDRLSELRELLHAMRAKDPLAQRRVYDYAETLLKIEARSLPQSLPVEEGMEPLVVPIEERPLDAAPLQVISPVEALPPVEAAPPVPPAPFVDAVAPAEAAASPAELLGRARAAFAKADFLSAIDILAPLTAPEATALRKEAVNAWCRNERESAGAAFAANRSLPAGPERTAALTQARDRLTAINLRFPDNTFAASIADNIARVNAELGN
jgi:hypothetical protein